MADTKQTWSALAQAQDTKRLLLERISQASTMVDLAATRLREAYEDRARAIQEARDSQLTTPGERSRAAGISKQYRLKLEALPLPLRQPDPATTDSYTDPLPFTNGEPRP